MLNEHEGIISFTEDGGFDSSKLQLLEHLLLPTCCTLQTKHCISNITYIKVLCEVFVLYFSIYSSSTSATNVLLLYYMY